MSESFAERLSRFTPDGTGLDRDALLFAAGQSSVRPSHRWAALTGILAASQLLTLVLLWPRATPSPVHLPDDSRLADIVEPSPVTVEAPIPVLEPSSLIALRSRALALDGNLPPPPPVEGLVPSGPPLRAFADPRTVLIH